MKDGTYNLGSRAGELVFAKVEGETLLFIPAGSSDRKLRLGANQIAALKEVLS